MYELSFPKSRYSAPILVLAKVNKRNKYVFFVSTAMGKDYCAIKDCHNTTGTIGRFNKSVKLHHLPKKQSLRSAWIRAISRSNYKGGHHTYVCSDHFPDGGSMRCQRYSSPKRRRKSTKNVQQEIAEKLWQSQVPRTLAIFCRRTKLANSIIYHMHTELLMQCKNIYFVLKDDIAEALSADLALSRSAASVLIDHQ